jgi:hypothetical protein
MARPKKAAGGQGPQPKRMGRPPVLGGAKASTFTLRVRDDWKDWLGRFAYFCRRDKADLIDEALEAFAKVKGFESPPKR